MVKPQEMWSVTLGRVLILATSVFSNAAYAKPPVPVIFIHGVIGNATSWEGFGNLLKRGGWTFGGCPISLAPGSVGNLCPTSGSLLEGDFYRMQFSDNQDLSFSEQGQELETVIDAVLSVNPGKRQVILVGHSMGGLASRDYLELRFKNNNVLKLITVGTPHKGANLTFFCQAFPLACSLIIDPSSRAVTELMPASPALLNLNDLVTHPLPHQVSYTSIIGTGTPVLAEGGQDGDGIVTVESQNLRNIVGTQDLNHKAISIPIDKCRFIS